MSGFAGPSLFVRSTMMGEGRYGRTGRAGRAAVAAAVAIVASVPVIPGSSSSAAAAVAPCTKTWDGGAGLQSWHQSASWSPDGVPSSTDVACIPAGASVFIRAAAHVAALDSDGTLMVNAPLDVDGESEAANLRLEFVTFDASPALGGLGSLTIPAGGTMTWSSGPITLAGGLNVADGGRLAIVDDSGRRLATNLRNHGTIDWSGGRVDLETTATTTHPMIDNRATMSIDITNLAGQQLAWVGGPTRGTLESTDPASRFTVTNTSGSARNLRLYGVASQIRDLNVSGTGTSVTGSGSGFTTLTGTNIRIGAGALLSNEDSTLRIEGNMGGAGVLRAGSATTLAAGSTVDLDTVTVPGPAVFVNEIELAVRSLTLGPPSVFGNADITGSGDVRVPDGGIFESLGGNVAGTGTLRVDAGGELRPAGGVGARTNISRPVDLAGTVHVTGGETNITGAIAQLVGTTLTGGTWEVDAGADLRIPNVDIRRNEATVALHGNAMFRTDVGNPALRNLATNVGTLRLLDGADLSVTGTLTNAGVLDLSPTTNVAAAALQQSGLAQLQVHLAGSSSAPTYPTLTAGGAVTLAGTLDLDVPSGFAAPIPDMLLINGSSLGGSRFDAVVGGALTDGNTIDAAYDDAAGDVVLTLEAPPPPPTGVGNDLGEAGAAAAAAFPSWAHAFDLGSAPLPVVTGQLRDALGVDAALAGAVTGNPFAGLDGDLEAISAELEARGCTILHVEGGLGGRPAPVAAGDVIEARCPIDLGSLAVDPTFSGDLFGDLTPAVLDSLGSGVSLDALAGFDLTGGLRAEVVVGVDASGPYVSGSSAVALTADLVDGVVGGGVHVGGLDVGVTGLADADLDLLATPGSGRARPADADALAGQAVPHVSGTAGLTLDLTVGGVGLAWSASYAPDTQEDGTLDVPVTPALAGSLALPGLEGGPVALTGTLVGSLWMLAGGREGPVALAGVTIHGLAVELLASPGAIGGAAGLTVSVDPTGTGSTDVAVSGTVSATTLALDGSAEIGALDIGSAQLTGVRATVGIDAALDGGSTTVDVSLTADSIGNGALQCTGPFTIHLPVADGTDLLGPDDVTCTLPALADLRVTVTGLAVDSNGTFRATTVSVGTSGLNETIGLGGVLPFELTGVTVAFTDPTVDLSQMAILLEGRFDLTPFEGLPFTPRVGLGGAVVTPTTPEAENHFELEAEIVDGVVRPLNVSDITFGFDDLSVGPLTLGAALTLGGIVDGEPVNTAGGDLTVAGLGVAGVDQVVTTATGGIASVEGGSQIDVSGTTTIDGTLPFGVVYTGLQLEHRLVLTYANGAFTLEPHVKSLNVGLVRIPVASVLDLEATTAAFDFTAAPGEPLATFDSLALDFVDAEELTGWGGDVSNVGLDDDLRPIALDDFGVALHIPETTPLGIPEEFPFDIDLTRVGLVFPNTVPGGPLDASGMRVQLSGGINILPPGDDGPLLAANTSVQGLEIDPERLVAGDFPITGVQGGGVAVDGIRITDELQIGGALQVGVVPEDNPETLYVQIKGTFAAGGIGGGINLVISELGPVVAEITAPLGIPIEPSGTVLQSVTGGVLFGTESEGLLVEPAEPGTPGATSLLRTELFDLIGDVEVSPETIERQLLEALDSGESTWTTGALIQLTGTLTHLAVPGFVTADATIGINLVDDHLDLFGKAEVDAFGMTVGQAGIYMDLEDLLNPKVQFGFVSPHEASPLKLLFPIEAHVDAYLDTEGLAEGTAVALRTFFTSAAASSNEVLQSVMARLASDLQANSDASGAQGRTLTRLVFEGLPEGTQLTRATLWNRLLELLDTQPEVALKELMIELNASAANLVEDGEATLGALKTGMLDLVAGLRDAVRQAKDAFFAVADPVFRLEGTLQPTVLGIPLGEPQDRVSLRVTKESLTLDVKTTIIGLIARANAGPLGFLTIDVSKAPLTDSVTLAAELPVEGLFDTLLGAAFPSLNLESDAWGVQITGHVGMYGFDLAGIGGMLVPPGNDQFVEDHSERIYEQAAPGPGDPPRTFDPEKVPLLSAEDRAALVEHGGLVLSVDAQAPALLVDPLFIARGALSPPDDPVDYPAWIEAITAQASAPSPLGIMQLYLPPVASGGEARMSGFWDARLLSIPIGNGTFSVDDDGMHVRAQIPWVGYDAKATIEKSPPGELPRAGLEVAIGAGTERPGGVTNLFAALSLPDALRPPSPGSGFFRAFTPGFDPAAVRSDGGADTVRRNGGIEAEARLRLPDVLGGGENTFRFALASSKDFDATASISDRDVGPLHIDQAAVTVRRRTAGSGLPTFSIHLNGRGTVLGAAVTVDGVLSSSGFGALHLTLDDGQTSTIAGFTLNATAFDLTLSSAGAELAFSGTVGLPAWLGGASGQTTATAVGRFESDGDIDLALSLTQVSLGPGGTVAISRRIGTTAPPLLRITRTGATGDVEVAVAGRVRVPGTDRDVLVNGALASDGTGRLLLDLGTTPLRFTGTPFSVAGTICIYRGATPTGALPCAGAFASGGAAVTLFNGRDVTLRWQGVGSFDVPSFRIGSDGVAAASVPGRTFALPGGTALRTASVSFLMNAGGLDARLQVGAAGVTVPDLVGPGTGGELALPAFTVRTADFSVVLVDGTYSIGSLAFNGQLTFAKAGSVFSLRVGPRPRQFLPAQPPSVSFGLVRLTLPTFAVASNGTFDVHAVEPTLIGDPDLGLVARDIRLQSLLSRDARVFRLTVDDPRLQLPVGAPVVLPDITIGSGGTFNRTFSSVPMNLGVAFRVGGGTYRLSLSSTSLTFALVEGDTNRPGVTTLAGSDVSLRTLRVTSGGTFSGSVRGVLRVFDRPLATETFTLSIEDSAITAEMTGDTEINLGFIRMATAGSGWFRSTGSFRFEGSGSFRFPDSGTAFGFAAGGSVSLLVSSRHGVGGEFSGFGQSPLGYAGASGSVSYRGRISGTLTFRDGDGRVRFQKSFSLRIGTGYFVIYDADGDPEFEYDFLDPNPFPWEELDETAPVFTPSPPPDQVVNIDIPSTGRAGVVYDLPAVDDDVSSPDEIVVICSPPPGSQFTAGSHTISCDARDKAGRERTRSFTLRVNDVSTGGPSTITAGSTEAFTASGYAPESYAEATLYSSPRLLGWFQADASGQIRFEATIPTDLPPGEHHLLLVGEDPSGTKLTTEWVFTVLGSGTAEPEVLGQVLPRTGSATVPATRIGVELVVIGLLLAGARRRLTTRA